MQVLPLAVVFVGMVAFNNMCLAYVEVTFYQVRSLYCGLSSTRCEAQTVARCRWTDERGGETEKRRWCDL